MLYAQKWLEFVFGTMVHVCMYVYVATYVCMQCIQYVFFNNVRDTLTYISTQMLMVYRYSFCSCSMYCSMSLVLPVVVDLLHVHVYDAMYLYVP